MISLTTDVALFRRFARELVENPRAAEPPLRDTSRDRGSPDLSHDKPSDVPDLSAYGAGERDAARIAWATRIVDEYRSVAVFSELLRLMADLEASFPALCAVHRLIGDELRHTEVTAQVVEWLGGRADLGIDLSDVGLPPRAGDESPATRALHIIGRELVVAEEESIYALAAYRNATMEPAIRRVLDGMLADEVRHAAAGRALFAELVHRVEDRARLEAVMAEDREMLREEYRRSARGGEGRALGGSIELADLEAIWSRL